MHGRRDQKASKTPEQQFLDDVIDFIRACGNDDRDAFDRIARTANFKIILGAIGSQSLVTPLHLAVYNGHIAIVRRLLLHAETNLYIKCAFNVVEDGHPVARQLNPLEGAKMIVRMVGAGGEEAARIARVAALLPELQAIYDERSLTHQVRKLLMSTGTFLINSVPSRAQCGTVLGVMAKLVCSCKRRARAAPVVLDDAGIDGLQAAADEHVVSPKPKIPGAASVRKRAAGGAGTASIPARRLERMTVVVTGPLLAASAADADGEGFERVPTKDEVRQRKQAARLAALKAEMDQVKAIVAPVPEPAPAPAPFPIAAAAAAASMEPMPADALPSGRIIPRPDPKISLAAAAAFEFEKFIGCCLKDCDAYTSGTFNLAPDLAQDFDVILVAAKGQSLAELYRGVIDHFVAARGKFKVVGLPLAKVEERADFSQARLYFTDAEGRELPLIDITCRSSDMNPEYEVLYREISVGAVLVNMKTREATMAPGVEKATFADEPYLFFLGDLRKMPSPRNVEYLVKHLLRFSGQKGFVANLHLFHPSVQSAYHSKIAARNFRALAFCPFVAHGGAGHSSTPPPGL